ncbi:MAG TPA: hypothetical protein DCM28_05130 [Phycisphaerales bacterium]|nr:hypothetical protein [Phycisphaerales bacterium]HCD34124.1 hypothetical protein [Phycisphaerales bacterium]|tara:strand:- start:2361 stop:2954 length:594 start_codon:yes stop_codon:yes gene_type:complete
MAEKALTNTQANALAATTNATTGMTYPTANEDPWMAAYNRQLDQVNAVAVRGNDLRVYEVDGNADAIGVRPGRKAFANTVLIYAGADPAVDSLTDNDTTYIWLYNASGAATIGSAIDATGWPAVPHVKLAEVTMADGVITSILDRRGEGLSDILLPVYDDAGRPAAGYAGRMIFNSDDGHLNIDDGTNWTLPDGTTT